MKIDGARVRARRESLGLSQSEVARRVGIKQQSLGPIENGSVRRTGYLLELAEVLSVNPEWLMGLTDDPTQRPITDRLSGIIYDIPHEDHEEAMRLILAWRAAKRRD